MFQNFFYRVLQTKKLTGRMIYEQDGAPAHFAKIIYRWLYEQVQRLMSWKKRTYSCTPRSPDSSLLDSSMVDISEQVLTRQQIKIGTIYKLE